MTISARWSRAVLGLVLLSAVGSPVVAPAAVQTIVAGPYATVAGFATPVAVAVDGADVSFVNADLPLLGFGHNVAALDVFGSDDRPWCATEPLGRCPLFWSPVAPPGGKTTVQGLDQAEAGRSYRFFCQQHPQMTGTLSLRARDALLPRADQATVQAEIRGLAAVLPLRADAPERALQAYGSLLPAGVAMPAEPALAVSLMEVHVPRALPGRPQDPASHWIEGALQVRAAVGDEEGWYPISAPTTSEARYLLGRRDGIPQYHATGSVAAEGATWRATATRNGRTVPSIDMTWSPAAAEPDPAERSLTQPSFTLEPPLNGPNLMRVQTQLRAPIGLLTLASDAPVYRVGARFDPGTVRVALDPDVDAVNEDVRALFGSGTLAEIVEVDQTVPGVRVWYSVSMERSSARVGSGGY